MRFCSAVIIGVVEVGYRYHAARKASGLLVANSVHTNSVVNASVEHQYVHHKRVI
jgi:hypothetical protein